MQILNELAREVAGPDRSRDSQKTLVTGEGGALTSLDEAKWRLVSGRAHFLCQASDSPAPVTRSLLSGGAAMGRTPPPPTIFCNRVIPGRFKSFVLEPCESKWFADVSLGNRVKLKGLGGISASFEVSP